VNVTYTRLSERAKSAASLGVALNEVSFPGDLYAEDQPMTTTTASQPDNLGTLCNRICDEIAVGGAESMECTLTTWDIQLYAILSGDENPQHLDEQFAASTRFHGVIGDGMWAGALISVLIGTRLPGPGSIYLGQKLKFRAPVRIGDTLTITVTARNENTRRVRLACRGVNQDGQAVIEGDAEVTAPDARIEHPRATLPEVSLSVGCGGLQRLLKHVRPLGATCVAVVHSCDALSVLAALDAHAAGLIEPVLVVPDLESGNMLAKQLAYISDAASTGVVLAAKCRSC